MKNEKSAKTKTKKVRPISDEPVENPITTISGDSGSMAKAEMKTPRKAAAKVASKKPGKDAATKVHANETAGKPEKKTAKKAVPKKSGNAVTTKVQGEEAPRKSGKRPTRKTSGSSSLNTPSLINPEERHRLIREAAYYLAERRGFEGGHPSEDWVEAEAEIDQMLFDLSSSGS